MSQTYIWKYCFQKFHPLEIIQEKDGEERGLSEEGQRNIQKFG